jgi:hypothetical protein
MGNFNTPSSDYSMALAQWWRLLESILKRGIAGELFRLFQQHPEWVEWDRKNLSEAQQEKEKVFIKMLADPKRAIKMTLGDILLILQKCVLDSQKSNSSGSRLRMESTNHLKKYAPQLIPLVKESWLHPISLTNETVTFFRNRASHDACINSGEAFVGRVIARRLLDGFFSPVLAGWGFKPRIEI